MGGVDFLVIGAGIAGLRAAAELSRAGRVLVVTKEALGESNTAYAQGGIAVAMEGEQDIALHLEDTISAGDGLVDPVAAAVLVEEGPRRVQELLAWGTSFDRKDGELMRTREGAHSRPRILHAHGDATGREIAASLLRHVRAQPGVELREWTTTVDLVTEDGRIAGATLLTRNDPVEKVSARSVLLAAGGAGQVYSETTNPPVATGDGIAMAWRAGAELMDMEFMQFHPTAFALEGAPRFLISEALRGEGGLLVNAAGERFMHRYDRRLELAPRDIVARAIAREAQDGKVYLDMRGVSASVDLKARFPGISAFLGRYGLELGRDPVPVLPAAHYLMGGIRTDTHGRTSLPGLYAAGECACTGAHGANRLASNSLLEGLVFGARAAAAMATESSAAGALPTGYAALSSEAQKGEPPDSDEIERQVGRLRALMWRHAGLLRDHAGLAYAEAELASWQLAWPHGISRRAIEAGNLLSAALLIVRSALARKESRGAHFRTDFPHPADPPLHSVISRQGLRFL